MEGFLRRSWTNRVAYIQTTPRKVIGERLTKNDVVLIPLGSTEIHGDHSVSDQDTIQVTRFCEAVRRYTQENKE